MDPRSNNALSNTLEQARQYLNELKCLLQQVEPPEQLVILEQLQELNDRYVYQDLLISRPTCGVC